MGHYPPCLAVAVVSCHPKHFELIWVLGRGKAAFGPMVSVKLLLFHS